jgi:hypothetical protein
MKIKIGSKDLKRIVGEYLEKNLNVDINDSKSWYHGEGVEDNREFGLISIEFDFEPKTNKIPDKIAEVDDRKLEPEL